MVQMTDKMSLSLAGRSLRWKFPGGPTGDTIYEHVFKPDGTVIWRDVHGNGERKKEKEEWHPLVGELQG